MHAIGRVDVLRHHFPFVGIADVFKYFLLDLGPGLVATMVNQFGSVYERGFRTERYPNNCPWLILQMKPLALILSDMAQPTMARE